MANYINNKQKLFVEAYIENKMNGTQAAITAGYSTKTARASANQLLKNPAVREEIETRLTELLSDTELLTKEWLTEVRNGALFDIRDVIEHGKRGIVIRDLSQLSDRAARMITEISDTKDGIKVKFLSKEKMLELYGKYLSVLGDNLPPISDEKQQSIEKAKERLAYLDAQERKLRG